MSEKIIHTCSKERELGIMATKIENIEKDVKELKNDFKGFINSFEENVSKKYATKEELNGLRAELDYNSFRDRSIRSKAWQVFIQLIPYLFIMLMFGAYYVIKNGGF